METITRNEKFIDAASSNSPSGIKPVTRIELFLDKIAGSEVEVPEPVTRIEKYLAKIAGLEVELPSPITRVEMFLATVAGMDIEPPEPITRIEILLSEWQGGSSWSYDTVSGTSPLSLPSAFAHALQSLIQEGAVEQSTTPTPSAPVDIVCNNGAIKYGALGANLLDPSAANTVLGYYINKADGVIKDSSYNFMFAGYMPVEAGKTYVAYGRAKNGNDLSDYNRVAWYDSTKTWISGADYTQNQIAVVTAPNNAAYARFSCNPSGGTTVAVTQAIVDSYNWMFAEGTAEITPFVPFVGGIYTDGTPEVLTIGGKNLNGGTIENKGYTSTGGESTSTTFAGTLWKIPCEEGQKFTASWSGFPDGVSGVFINTWLTDGTWNARQAISASTSLTYTIGAGVGIVNFTLYKTGGITIGDNAWMQVEYGSSPTDYEPYLEPQTASAEYLFAVGSFADTQDIISGEVKRKCGIYVFNGTETWIDGNYGYITEAVQDQSGETYTPLSTHFKGTTGTPQSNSNTFRCYRTSGGVGRIYIAPNRTTYDTKEAFAAFIAAQYAAGTPVIVLYPLATEQTETVAGQALATVEGDNVISVAAEVKNIKLEATYAKKEA